MRDSNPALYAGLKKTFLPAKVLHEVSDCVAGGEQDIQGFVVEDMNEWTTEVQPADGKWRDTVAGKVSFADYRRVENEGSAAATEVGLASSGNVVSAARPDRRRRDRRGTVMRAGGAGSTVRVSWSAAYLALPSQRRPKNPCLRSSIMSEQAEWSYMKEVWVSSDPARML
jgi:hypothetical protein